MKNLILAFFSIFLFVGYSECETLLENNHKSLIKQDPKTKSQTIKKKQSKKTEKKDMLDNKISISDENQPINKSKSKKTK